MHILPSFQFCFFVTLSQVLPWYIETESIKRQYVPFSFFSFILIAFCLNVLILILPSALRLLTKCFLYLIFYFVAIIDLVCFFITRESLSPVVTNIILDTNSIEFYEFVSTQIHFLELMIKLFPIWILLFINILVEKQNKRIGQSTFILRNRKIALIVFLLCLFVCSHTLYRFEKTYTEDFMDKIEVCWPQSKPMTAIGRLIVAIGCNLRDANHVNHLIKVNENIAEVNGSFSNCDIVVIIGESYNKYHSQLYGYEKDTTPLQVKRLNEGELVVFRNAFTNYNFTSQAIKQLFSTNINNSSWWDCPWFPAVFRKANYWSCFLSNQHSDIGVSELAQYNIGTALNNPLLRSQLFDYSNDESFLFDEGLLTMLKKFLPQHNENNLFILHLMGQHFDYKNRYPRNRTRFTINDYDRDDLKTSDILNIAHYDNATRYNDSIVDAVITLFENRKAAVLYISDHGEEVFDNQAIMGRTFGIMNENVIRNEFHIPFWIWFSKMYRKEHQQIVNEIIESSILPITSREFAPIAIKLGGIEFN